MGELFPVVVILIALVIVIAALAYKSNKLKPSDEQDVVTRFKVNFSNSKAKEVAGKLMAAAEKNEPVVEFYEEGTERLIRFEIN